MAVGPGLVGLFMAGMTCFVGIGAIAYTQINSFTYSTPGEDRVVPLSEDSEFEHKYKGRWGGKYANRLVSTKGNRKWWTTKIDEFSKSLEAKPTEGMFKLVDGTITGEHSLMNLCEAAYRADEQNVKEIDPDKHQFKESDVWKYCSFNGFKG